MCRRTDLVLLLMMIPPLLICAPSPAIGQDAPGHSTWKIVHAPAPTEDFAPQPEPSHTWPESLVQTSVAPPQPTATQQSPAPPRAIPRQSVRAVFPSQQASSFALSNRVRPAVGYTGGAGGSGVSPASYFGPPRMSVAPSSQPVRRQSKPFSNLVLDPAISPYLNLDRDEDAVELPNYYAFVRPQLEQQEADRRQQREFQQLERQWNNVSTAPAGPAYQGSSGRTARFMDTAQYYERWPR